MLNKKKWLFFFSHPSVIYYVLLLTMFFFCEDNTPSECAREIAFSTKGLDLQ